jgi:hypothetical protein
MAYQPLLSQQTRLDLYRAYTKRIDPFLDLYEYLFARNTEENWEDLRYPPSMDVMEISTADLKEVLANSKRILLSGLKTESVKDFVVTEIEDLRVLVSRLDRDITDRTVVRMFASRLAKILDEIAADAEIYLLGKPVIGNLGFLRFRKSTAEEEQIEKINKDSIRLKKLQEIFKDLQG